MNSKKHPKKDLSPYRSLFIGIGALLSLIIVLMAFEYPSATGSAWVEIPFNDDSYDMDAVFICSFPPPPLEQDTSKNAKDIIYLIAEEEASFPGGKQAWGRFLKEHFHPPHLQQGIKGKIFLSFVVDANGKLSGVNVIRGVTPKLDSAAVRAMNFSPDWLPARQHGQPVKSRKILSIDVHLKR